MPSFNRILLAAIAGAGLALPAAAQVGAAQLVITGQDEPWVTRQAVAHLGDLDLSRASDAREAMARIHLAARRVCSAIDGPILGAGQFEVFNRCMDEAESRAVEDVGSPALVAVYRAEGRLG